MKTVWSTFPKGGVGGGAEYQNGKYMLRIFSYLFYDFYWSAEHFVLASKLVPQSTVFNVRLNDRFISYNFHFYLHIYCVFSM